VLLHQLVQRLRVSVHVPCELVDGLPHHPQRRAQAGLARAVDAPEVARRDDRGKHGDDRQDDHQLDEREACPA
jgi:hypothetical protein